MITVDQEEWKDIPDTVGYQVSSLGRVQSFWRRFAPFAGAKFNQWEWAITNTPKELTISKNNKGYHMVRLQQNGKQKLVPIHLLVLIAFVGPRPAPKLQGRHLDDNKDNNCLTNLGWGTQSKNMQERQTTRGDSHAVFKLAPKDVVLIRSRLANGITHRSIASEFGVSAGFVSLIHNNKRWGYFNEGDNLNA